MKVAELKGVQLAYWVAMTLGIELHKYEESEGCGYFFFDDEYECERAIAIIGTTPVRFDHVYRPDFLWNQAGKIIGQERISIRQYTDPKFGKIIIASMEERQQPVAGENLPKGAGWWTGSTPLEASMRCFVASMYGVEVPDESETKGAR
jgi:hypothetical protein